MTKKEIYKNFKEAIELEGGHIEETDLDLAWCIDLAYNIFKKWTYTSFSKFAKEFVSKYSCRTVEFLEYLNVIPTISDPDIRWHVNYWLEAHDDSLKSVVMYVTELDEEDLGNDTQYMLSILKDIDSQDIYDWLHSDAMQSEVKELVSYLYNLKGFLKNKR